ncbi:hypothetical protein GT755_27100 [Herbidospora sp. NEAU-GS84]|uniref:Uncharacterized protein n=1 Tax=Herbidospora solisilvae TaxID=2696284 RepID=A0A7C9JYF4_9ACTN|nr:hypothetical protein [Herbidospora solisilvae]NAS25339.1 hypothetical protein [Herbidospora solisilvae]
MIEEGIRTVQLELYVEDCSMVHLLEQDGGQSPNPARRFGDIEIREGVVDLVINTQWGDDIPFTVTVADRDPGAGLDDYEDITEIDYYSPSGKLVMAGFSFDWDEEKAPALPPLPAGPGNYRLRYHVRGADWESCLEGDHYLQIWPSEPAEPKVVKATSHYYKHLVSKV